jgi:hypothetical protein
VQSLNFVVATVIGVFPDDEALVFSCAQALLFRHSLADFYRPRFPKLGLAVWQFDRIVEGFLPKVHAALQRHGVTAEYYAMQWFLTLFAGDLPQPVVRRIWDRFLIAGWQVIVQVGLALLQEVENELLAFDDCEMLIFLKRFVSVRRFRPEELLRAASSFEVSHQMLSELEAAYSWEESADAELLIEQGNGSNHKVRWVVQRRTEPVPVPHLGMETPGDMPSIPALARARPSPTHRKAPPTVLPFLLHNLDTGETTIMEEEWGFFVSEQPARQEECKLVAPQVRRCGQDFLQGFLHGSQHKLPSNPKTGGCFWSQSRQHQALRALGKV